MHNYNKQQEAVILKGIALQIMNMNMPSVSELKKLLDSFDIQVNNTEKHILLTSQPINEKIKWIRFPVRWAPGCNSPVDIYYALRSDCSEAIEMAEEMARKFSNQCGYIYIYERNDKFIDSRFGEVIRCYECNGRYWVVIRNPYWIP